MRNRSTTKHRKDMPGTTRNVVTPSLSVLRCVEVSLDRIPRMEATRHPQQFQRDMEQLALLPLQEGTRDSPIGQADPGLIQR